MDPFFDKILIPILVTILGGIIVIIIPNFKYRIIILVITFTILYILTNNFEKPQNYHKQPEQLQTQSEEQQSQLTTIPTKESKPIQTHAPELSGSSSGSSATESPPMYQTPPLPSEMFTPQPLQNGSSATESPPMYQTPPLPSEMFTPQPLQNGSFFVSIKSYPSGNDPTLLLRSRAQ